MLRSTILASLLSLAAAQNKTLEWFFPGAEGSDLVASIVSANPSTTVAVLNCPTSVDSSDCGFGPGVSLSIISTTIYQAVMSESDFTMSVSCVYKTSEMPCSVSIAGGNDPGNTVETFSGSDIGFLTATVTAGGEKLSASAGGASLSGQSSAFTSSATAGGKSASGASAASTGTRSVSGSGSGTAAAASATGTGAAYRFGVEGGAMLALAGAAAVVAAL